MDVQNRQYKTVKTLRNPNQEMDEDQSGYMLSSTTWILDPHAMACSTRHAPQTGDLASTLVGESLS